MKLNLGHISIHRKIIESEIWKKPPLYVKIWLYILLRAQHTDYNKLKRGQLFISVPEIQESCSWYVGFRKEMPSRKEVRQVIDWLRDPHARKSDEGSMKGPMIVTTKGTHGMLVNVCKYNDYQYSKKNEGPHEGPHEKFMKGTQRAQYKQECNNVKNNTSKQKKSSQKIYEDESLEMNISKYLLTSIQEWNPKYKAKNIQTWCNDIRLLHSRDEQSIEDIKKVIAWSARDEFWRKNILSAGKLRKQFDVLYAHMISDKEQTKSTKVVDMHALQIRKQMIGEWIASGRDPDDPAMEDWINRGGNLHELRRTNGT